MGIGRRNVFTAFYVRRFLRIFPLYYAVLALTAALDLPGARRMLPWNTFYLSNFYVYSLGPWPPTLGHFWSLAVEEQFYLVWPWVILLAPRRILAALLGLMILGSVAAFYLTIAATRNRVCAEVLTSSNLDVLGAGALIALFSAHAREDHTAIDHLAWWALVVAVFLSTVAWTILFATDRASSLRHTLEHAVHVLVFAYLVNACAGGCKGLASSVLSFRPLVYLGTISYGLYVYHFVLQALSKQIGTIPMLYLTYPNDPGLAKLTWTLILTIPVAALSWHFFEKPLNDLKRRFPYLHTDAVEARNKVPRVLCAEYSPEQWS